MNLLFKTKCCQQIKVVNSLTLTQIQDYSINLKKNDSLP